MSVTARSAGLEGLTSISRQFVSSRSALNNTTNARRSGQRRKDLPSPSELEDCLLDHVLVAITDGGNESPPELTDRAAAVTSCLPCIYRIHLPARLLRPAAIGWPVAEPNPGSASGHPPEGAGRDRPAARGLTRPRMSAQIRSAERAGKFALRPPTGRRPDQRYVDLVHSAWASRAIRDRIHWIARGGRPQARHPSGQTPPNGFRVSRIRPVQI